RRRAGRSGMDQRRGKRGKPTPSGANKMGSNLLQQYMDPLIGGQRKACRDLVASALASGSTARALYRDLIWPAMSRVDELYRDDRINLATEHLATRINRVVADH